MTHWLQPLTSAALKLMGWRVEGPLPVSPKCVAVVYPHTSNWDGPIGLSAGYAHRVLGGECPHGFMIKIEWTRGFFGPLVRALGGIGIDRGISTNAVEQMAAIFASRERLLLAITPEGTRKYRGFWRTGFYQIALRANVPIVLASLDYRQKLARIGPELWLTGDVAADLDRVRQFYEGVQGKVPSNQAPIRFRDQRLTDSPEG
ncbi:MAG: 1-acyl-sn-glycerol-3-phosphate acyltransferase [Anaerolineales bacterium]|nr:1-acyl-sn-glycerol-3-phosphate acyltransferase [Anaerolineales bacterium]